MSGNSLLRIAPYGFSPSPNENKKKRFARILGFALLHQFFFFFFFFCEQCSRMNRRTRCAITYNGQTIDYDFSNAFPFSSSSPTLEGHIAAICTKFEIEEDSDVFALEGLEKKKRKRKGIGDNEKKKKSKKKTKKKRKRERKKERKKEK